jgi:hypothetical protein
MEMDATSADPLAQLESARTSSRTSGGGFHIELITHGEPRRRWSLERKQAIASECFQSGVPPTAVARRHPRPSHWNCPTSRMMAWSSRRPSSRRAGCFRSIRQPGPLDTYLVVRLRVATKSEALLIGNTGEAVAMAYPTIIAISLRLSGSMGLRGLSDRGGPRIHDLRHNSGSLIMPRMPREDAGFGRFLTT